MLRSLFTIGCTLPPRLLDRLRDASQLSRGPERQEQARPICARAEDCAQSKLHCATALGTGDCALREKSVQTPGDVGEFADTAGGDVSDFGGRLRSQPLFVEYAARSRHPAISGRTDPFRIGLVALLSLLDAMRSFWRIRVKLFPGKPLGGAFADSLFPCLSDT